MTNISQIPTKPDRYDEASHWIVKLDRGLSHDEEIALQEWMALAPENQTILLQMTQLWDKMDAMSRLSDLFAKPTRQKRPWQMPYIAIAASVIFTAAAGLWLLFPDSSAIDDQYRYQTAVGEQSTVMLSDGTKMILNTNTIVTVEYSDHQRLLHLAQGELHVNVAKDKNRPLSVIARDQVVQAIGTEFNIEITSDQQIELVVTEGKVKVGVAKPQKKLLANAPPTSLPEMSRTVSAGEKIILGANDHDIVEVTADDIEVKLSWRQGNLIFRGESLEDAVREVGRYTSVEFIFTDDDLKKTRVAGLFKAGDVEGLLATLRENFDIVSQRIDKDKVLLSAEQ